MINHGKDEILPMVSQTLGNICVLNLRFADDIDLMGENTQDAQDILNNYSVHTETYGRNLWARDQQREDESPGRFN